MKTSICTIAFCAVLALPAFSQNQSGQQKPPVKPLEKAEQASQKLADESMKASQQAQQAGENLRAAGENIKAIIQVFEPIVNLRLKKKVAQPAEEAATPGIAGQDMQATLQQEETVLTWQDLPADPQAAQTVWQPESAAYNLDGSANLGNQNHTQFGCYVDILQGRVMDDIDAAGEPRSVDLIFTATDYFNAQVPMYALLTPAFAKNDNFAYTFFHGTKFKDRNIPPRGWENVNESEIALAPITGEQFDRIQNNNQLSAVVKQCQGFSQKFESRTKLEGKVFAIKTEMGDRTAYGLMHVMNHYGTTGASGYLKIRLKVTGFDTNGNGIPDSALYQVRQY